MNIPLHMLLLAGLLAPATLPAQTAASAAATAPAEPQPYAGVNLGYLSEKIRAEHGQAAIPAGIGVLVGFIDPSGPAAGKIEEGDILTRFDDQILVNASQFQSLVRLRKAGDTVKLTLVRGAEVQVAEVKLEGRVPKAFVTRPATPRAATGVVPTNPTPPAIGGASGRTSITINGQPIEIDVNGGKSQAGQGQVIVIGPNSQQLPPEVLKRLEEMRARGLPIPQLDQPGLGIGGSVTVAPGGSTQSFSKSFSFSLGSGTGGSSSSVASDEAGTVSLEEKDGKKHATIKDTSGKVVFDGEVTTPEQRAAMPEEARRRLKLVEGNGFSIPGFNGPGGHPKAEGAAKGGAAPAEEKPKKKRDAKEGA